MTPDLVTCNMAIGQAGSTQFLTRIDYDPATESVPLPAQLCLLYWDLSFDATAYAHDWTCLTQPSARANLSLTGTVTVAAGSMDTVTGTDTLFTSELAVGDRIQIGEEVRIIEAITDDASLTVTEEFGEESADAAATRVHQVAGTDYDGEFYLPADCIRVLGCDADRWTVRGTMLVADAESLTMEYIARRQSGWSAAFQEALVLRLAAWLSLSLTFDPARKERAEMWLERVCLPLGRFQDSRQQSVKRLTANTWRQSRR